MTQEDKQRSAAEAARALAGRFRTPAFVDYVAMMPDLRWDAKLGAYRSKKDRTLVVYPPKYASVVQERERLRRAVADAAKEYADARDALTFAKPKTRAAIEAQKALDAAAERAAAAEAGALALETYVKLVDEIDPLIATAERASRDAASRDARKSIVAKMLRDDGLPTMSSDAAAYGALAVQRFASEDAPAEPVPERRDYVVEELPRVVANGVAVEFSETPVNHQKGGGGGAKRRRVLTLDDVRRAITRDARRTAAPRRRSASSPSA
jgi:hypothetical protein